MSMFIVKLTDDHISSSDHISSISKSCFLSIRDLRRIRNTIDLTTAKTIVTSLIHYRPPSRIFWTVAAG